MKKKVEKFLFLFDKRKSCEQCTICLFFLVDKKNKQLICLNPPPDKDEDSAISYNFFYPPRCINFKEVKYKK